MLLKNLHNSISNIVLTIVITFNIVDFPITQTNKFIIYSGIASGLEETAGAIKGFGRLLDFFKSVIDIISNIVSPEVLLLFIAAAFIGLGLSFLGVPKGRTSFLCSVLIADLLWFIWLKSFNPELSGLIKKIFLIIKTNLIIIIPFIIIYFFKSQVFSRKFPPKVLSFLKSILKRKRPQDLFDKKEIALITSELNELFSMLQRSILNDILSQNDKDNIRLSADTLKHRKELEMILKKLEKNE